MTSYRDRNQRRPLTDAEIKKVLQWRREYLMTEKQIAQRLKVPTPTVREVLQAAGLARMNRSLIVY